ncbi:MAG: hypothetical protein LBS74_06490 [Oscillospiraceae bacterium]|jgi:hypothetical protein|nr:hypothetical protein [Oscillospiraceae bacterium]
MPNKGFSIVQKQVYELLAEQGFALKSAQDDEEGITALYVSESLGYELKYSTDNKFRLIRYAIEDGEKQGEGKVLETYFYDESSADAENEAALLASEFCDSLKVKKPGAITPAQRAQAKKDKESDETGALFFVNRFPSVLPEVREPLLAHKQHYGTLLPNEFCNQCVSIAILKLLEEKKEKQKLQKLFTMLSDMYKAGDLDVKAIIVQTLLSKITDESQQELAKSYMSEELIKAWHVGKRYYGKDIKPEKVSFMQKLLKSTSQQQSRLGE